MEKKSISVAVVLCSYIGKKFIEEQISSIIGQAAWSNKCKLLICDDGSDDGTVELIRTLQKQNSQIELVFNNSGNSGPAANFSYALTLVDEDIILLCDQDDVWCQNKLQLLLDKAQQEGALMNSQPWLCFSDLIVVDEKLNPIDSSFYHYQNISVDWASSVANLTIQNLAPGCTMIFNRALLDVALPFPKEIAMHDWWLIMVAKLVGKVSIEKTPLIKYRQHSSNSVGAVNGALTSYFRDFKVKLSKVRKNFKVTERQADYFYRTYHDVIVNNLSQEEILRIKLTANWSKYSFYKKLYFVVMRKIYKNNWLRTLTLLF